MYIVSRRQSSRDTYSYVGKDESEVPLTIINHLLTLKQKYIHTSAYLILPHRPRRQDKHYIQELRAQTVVGVGALRQARALNLGKISYEGTKGGLRFQKT